MGKSKRHHYVPRWVLRGFASNDLLLYQWDLRDASGRQGVGVGDAAVRKHHHRADDPAAFAKDPEDMAGDIEGPASDIARALISGAATIGKGERWKLAHFLGLAIARTPFAIRNRTEQQRDVAREMVQLKRDNPGMLFAGSAEIGIEHRIDADGELIVTKDDELHDMFESAQGLGRLIFTMAWDVLHAPSGEEFIVPDTGCTQHDDSVRPEPQALVSSEEAETVFPLTSTRALRVRISPATSQFRQLDPMAAATPDGWAAMYFTNPPAPTHTTVTPDLVRDLNLRAAAQADHLLFASTDRPIRAALESAAPDELRDLALRPRNVITLEFDDDAEQPSDGRSRIMTETDRLTTVPKRRADHPGLR